MVKWFIIIMIFGLALLAMVLYRSLKDNQQWVCEAHQQMRQVADQYERIQKRSNITAQDQAELDKLQLELTVNQAVYEAARTRYEEQRTSFPAKFVARLCHFDEFNPANS